jgi:CheY-like chemotaxis protein/HPt (histidine-containing phosphotransfer) domain-containing protein
VLSSAGSPLPLSELNRLGIQIALTKPVKQSELLDAITRVFGTATRDQAGVTSQIERRPEQIAPMKVLLAEDGRVNQIVAIKLLEERGHQVMVANNGEEAIDLWARERFDAVLMDVQMPVMGGFEATTRIRENEKASGAHIPIIAMTANAMKGDREHCLEVGMDDYVAKPVRSKELFTVLERFAPSADSKATPAPPSDPTAPAAETNQPTDKEVFDPVKFRSQAAASDVEIQLIDIFDEECGNFLAAIESAAGTGDAKALRMATHSLKGMIGNYGGRQAFQQAVRLDALAVKGDIQGVKECVPRMKDAVVCLKKALVAYRAQSTE